MTKLKNLDDVGYFKLSEDLVEILSTKMQTKDPLFFRVMVSYYFGVVASMMRATIDTPDRGSIPVSIYTIALASSGFGKGFSTNIMEEEVINQFRERFQNETLPTISSGNLDALAQERSVRKSSDYDEERAAVQKEYDGLGAFPMSFDSGTGPALKQIRHKALMSQAGSLNFQADEIGSNLSNLTDLLGVYLELYDKGLVKQKITKNTAENTRNEEIRGATPANMLLFGTPSKLLNGGKTEDEYDSFIETGFGRRCLFGLSLVRKKPTELSAEEMYDQLTSMAAKTTLEDISDTLYDLADDSFFGMEISIDKPVGVLLYEYKIDCERRAFLLPEHEEVRIAELTHRYFKTLKLAGAYAFIAGTFDITEELLYNAMKLVEDSGKAFEAILTREKPYIKLAKYLSSIGRAVTQSDLVEDLPFYKGNESVKKEMLSLATSYGYQKNISIKKHYVEGIEFISGASLEETNLNEVTLSYSKELAHNYVEASVKFYELDKLTQTDGYHWASHAFVKKHRLESNAIQGFNLIVIDVDDGVSMDTAAMLLKEYAYHMYTTKRHTEEFNRFRIIIPMSHTLKLDDDDFKEFMQSVFQWLPFASDEQTAQRSRKWLSHKGNSIFNEGNLFDVVPFIPRTTKAAETKSGHEALQSLSALERWFLSNTGSGNRSNQYIKYAYALVDAGLGVDDVTDKVMSLNSKLSDPMEEAEILRTTIVSASKRIYSRERGE